MPEPSAAARCSANTASIATGVFFAVICDDQFFVKITPEGQAAFPDLPKAPPYEGARDSFLVDDVEDRELMTALVRITCGALKTRPRKKRRK